MGELYQRHDHSDDEHFHHPPWVADPQHTHDEGKAGGNAAALQRQKDMDHDRDNCGRSQKRREEHESGDRPHALVPQGVNSADERGVVARRLDLEADDGKHIGEDEHYRGCQCQGQGMVDASVFDPVQLCPAPDTAGRPAGRECNLTLEQVTLVTGYDGHRTVHEFTCSILAICVPTGLNVLFQIVTQQTLTSLRYFMIVHCEISRKVCVIRNIVDIDGRAKQKRLAGLFKKRRSWFDKSV